MMDLIQTLRRIGQQMKTWDKTFSDLDSQYARHGLRIELTCGACPEQYDVFLGSQYVAYFRLRHGVFRVKENAGMDEEIIYEAFPNGDGCFDTVERLFYMNKALKALLKHYNP
jgi:hypothetical protein